MRLYCVIQKSHIVDDELKEVGVFPNKKDAFNHAEKLYEKLAELGAHCASYETIYIDIADTEARKAMSGRQEELREAVARETHRQVKGWLVGALRHLKANIKILVDGETVSSGQIELQQKMIESLSWLCDKEYDVVEEYDKGILREDADRMLNVVERYK